MADNMGTLSVDVALNIDTSVSEDQLREVLKNLEQEAITIKLAIDTTKTEEGFANLQGIIAELPLDIKNLTKEFKGGMAEINQAIDDVTQKINDLRDALNNAKKNAGEGSGFDFSQADESLNHMEKEVKEVGDGLTKLNGDKTGLGDVKKDAEQTSKAMEKTADSTKALKQASTEAAKTVIANEKQKQAEADKTTAKIEKQTEAIKMSNRAREALDKDYSQPGKTEALDKLYVDFDKSLTTRTSSYLSNLIQDFAVMQDFMEAINQGVNNKYLKKYRSQFEGGNLWWPENMTAANYLAEPNNHLKQSWEEINQQLQLYADLIDRVNDSGADYKLIPNLSKRMEEIVRIQGALTTANFTGDTEQAKAYSDQLRILNSDFDSLLKHQAQKQGVDNGAISQMAEQSKETVANLQEEKNVENEVAQAASAASEAIVSAENQEQAEIEQSIDAYNRKAEAVKEASNWAEQALSKDYTAKTDEESLAQIERLRNLYEGINPREDKRVAGHINGVSWENTEQATAAGYALAQALLDGWNRGLAEEDIGKMPWSIRPEYDDVEGRLQEEISYCKRTLEEFVQYNNQVANSLGGSGVNSYIQGLIASIVDSQDLLKSSQNSYQRNLSLGYTEAAQDYFQDIEHYEQRIEANKALLQDEIARINAVEAANQQLAQTTVNSEEQQQNAIANTVDVLRQEQELVNQAQVALNKDFTTNNAQEAEQQLRTALQTLQPFEQGKNISSEAGAEAGYAYIQSLLEAIRQGVSGDTINQLLNSWLEGIDFSKFTSPEQALGAENGWLSGLLAQNQAALESYASSYQQVIQQLGTLNISDNLKEQIVKLADLTTSITVTQREVDQLLSEGKLSETGQLTLWSNQTALEDDQFQLEHLQEVFQGNLTIEKAAMAAGEEFGKTMAEAGQKSVESVQEENSALQQTVQQASAGAEAVVNAENQKQAEIKETIAGLQEEAKAAQEVLNADYTTNSTKEARKQLKTTYAKVEELGGTQGVDSFYQLLGTEEGSAAAYAYLKAFQEAFKQEVGAGTIKANTIPALQIGAVSDMFDDRVTNSNQRVRLQDWLSIVEDNLKGIINFSKELDQYTQNHALTSDMSGLIQEVKELQELSHTQSSTDLSDSLVNSDRLRDVKDQLADLIYQENHVLEENAQQASSSADIFVSEEERKRAAALETAKLLQQRAIDQKQQEENWPQQLLNQNFDVRTKKQAEKQLKEAYASFESLDLDALVQENGRLNARYSRAGASAAYAFQKAFNEACEHGVDDDILSQYTPARLKEVEDISGYKEINSLTQNIQNFATEYTSVIKQLQGVPITSEIEQQIAYIESLEDRAWDLARIEKDTFSTPWQFENAEAAYKDQEKQISEAERKLKELIDIAKQASDSTQQDIQITEELSQVEQTHGEAGVAANQQVLSSAEGAAEGYKEITAAANEAAEAEKQANSLAEETLNKDYTASGKKQAGENLKAAYERLEQIRSQQDENGRINGIPWDQTEEGAAAGYAWGEAWMEGLRKGIAKSKLTNYVPDELTMFSGSEVDDAIRNSEYLLSSGEYPETLKDQQASFKAVLQDYTQLHNEVETELGEHSISDLIKTDMESVARARDQLRDAQASLAFDETNGYDTDREKEDVEYWQEALANREGQLQRDLEQVKQSYQEMGAEATEATATATEGFNQVTESEEGLLAINIIPDAEGMQKLGDNAHTAAESVQELEGTEEGLLAINIIPEAEALEQMSERGESAAESIQKVAIAEEQMVAADTSSEATELQQIGEAAEASDKPVEELKQDLQELSNTPVEPPTPTETPQQSPAPTPEPQNNNGLQQTKQDIKDVVNGYKALIKTTQEWIDLNAIDPADWTDKDIERLNELSIQREAANQAISKATELTSEEIVAQSEYNQFLDKLEKKQKNQISLEQKRADAVAERARVQEEAAAAEQAAQEQIERLAADAEAKDAQQIERLTDHTNKIYEEAEAERVRAQAAQEAADAEKAALEAYQVLEKNELQHQKNQALIDTGVPLNQNQRRIEDQYAAAKKVIEDTKVSTEALTKAEEHYQQTVADTKAIQAYQTLAKDIQTYTELTNKVSMGNDLTFRQQGQLQNLTNEMKQAWNVVKDYQAVTNEAVAAQSAWENKLASSQQTTVDFVASLGDSIGAYKSLAEAQKRVNEVFSTGKGGQLKWSGDQQATGTAKWGNELQKVQYTIRQVGNEQYQVYESIQSSQAATSTWGNLVNQVSKRFSSLVAYLSTFVSFYRILGAAKSGINTVTELNTQLTEMRKVSDESTESLKRYQDQTFAVAKEVGTTAAQIQSSTADYLRLGKSLEEAAELAKNTSILMSVSEFDSISDATEAMISMTQAFKEMSSMEIIDELNKIGEFNAETYSNIRQCNIINCNCRSELYRSISYG